MRISGEIVLLEKVSGPSLSQSETRDGTTVQARLPAGLTMDQEEAEGVLKRVSSPEFKIIEEFHMANLLSTKDPRSIKLLGSKSVNSLKLTEISRKLEIKLGKGV